MNLPTPIRNALALFRPTPKVFIIPDDQKEYVVRCCNSDGGSPHRNAKPFIWPRVGYVEMPNYKAYKGKLNRDIRPSMARYAYRYAKPGDGVGLYGVRRGGEQDGGVMLMAFSKPGCIYCLVEVRKDELMPIFGGHESKFPRGNVIYSGDFAGMMEQLRAVATTVEHHKDADALARTRENFIADGWILAD